MANVVKAEKLYVKTGGRHYREVGLYEVPYVVKPGWHLVRVNKNLTSFCLQIVPDTACLLAAKKMATEAVVDVLREASKSRVDYTGVSPEKRKLHEEAYAAYTAIMGDHDGFWATHPSIHDIAEKVVEAISRVE